MKKIYAITVSILIISGLFASCTGQTDILGGSTPNRPIYEDKIGQYVSIQEYGYIGTEIPISAKFVKELDFVNYGFKLEQTVSQNQPNGYKWSDILKITENDIGDAYDARNQVSRTYSRTDNYGEYEIAVTGVPKDGSGAITIYGKINIVPPPQISLDYDNKLFDEPQTFMLISDKPLDLVRVTDQDGTRHTLKTKDKYTFKTELTIHDRSFGDLKLEAYDRYGFELNDSVYVYNPEEIRICRPYVDIRVDGEKNTVRCVSYNREGKDERYEFITEIPDHIDYEYRTRLLKHPGARRQGLFLKAEQMESSGPGNIMGASPNGEWVIYTYREHIDLDVENCFVDDDGYFVRRVLTHNFVLLNTKTGATKLLGTRFIKDLITRKEDTGVVAQTNKEEGPFYYVLKWSDNNEVYLLEQTKDKTIYKGELKNSFPNMSITESPHTSARIVKMTLPDMTLHTTEFDPPREWVGYTDQLNGITGYTSPRDKCLGSKDGLLTRTDYSSLDLSVLSTMDSSKQYNINDFDYKKFIKSNGYESFTKSGFMLGTEIIGSGYIDNVPYVIMGIGYVPNVDDYGYEEEKPRVYPKMALNMETGKLIDIKFEGELSEFDTFNQTHISNIDGKIYFFIRAMGEKIATNIPPKSLKLVYLDKDMELKVESDIVPSLFHLTGNRKVTYIKKGGWYND